MRKEDKVWVLWAERRVTVARLSWDAADERFYESGIDRGVLYAPSQPGVAWTGLISVSESPSGGEAKPFYLDGAKYLNISGAEEFEATLVAFSAPVEFFPCDGNVSIQNGLIATHQPRRSFGFCYRTRIGNGEDAEHGYKLHLVYNALSAPSQRNMQSLSSVSSPSTYSWAITTLPPSITGYKPTAHLVIDSRYADSGALSDLEDLLYGTDMEDPSLPTPDEVVDIFTP
jgi:hypothetical protein